jgi:hypothetical protein
MKFNKDLYSTKAVLSAVEAYAELADFAVVEDAQYCNVEIKSVKEESVAGIIEDELANYVLYKMRS